MPPRSHFESSAFGALDMIELEAAFLVSDVARRAAVAAECGDQNADACRFDRGSFVRVEHATLPSRAHGPELDDIYRGTTRWNTGALPFAFFTGRRTQPRAHHPGSDGERGEDPRNTPPWARRRNRYGDFERVTRQPPRALG